MPPLVLLNHDLGGLDDRSDLVALLQSKFFGTSPGNYRLDDIISHFQGDERGNGPQQYFGDFALQMVASAECHGNFSSCNFRCFILRHAASVINPILEMLGVRMDAPVISAITISA